MYHGASADEEEHAEHGELITGVKLLSSEFPHREAQSHEDHCQPSKHPHDNECLNRLGGQGRHFDFEEPEGGDN